MGEVKNFLKFWLPVIAYAICIFWISSIEDPFKIELEIEDIDKIIHLFEYSILGFLLIRAICARGTEISKNFAIVITLAIGMFYGFTDELHQSVVPGRFASISDFVFDSVGSFVGAVTFTLIRR